MTYAIIVIISVITITLLVSFIIALNSRREFESLYNQIYEKYGSIFDVEEECNRIKNETDDYKNKVISEADEQVRNKNREIAEIERKISELRNDYSEKYRVFEKLMHEIDVYNEKNEIYDYGLYEPHFEFDTSERYKDRINEIREKQKMLVKSKSAAQCQTEWSVTDRYGHSSRTEGRKHTNRILKLMLRAFNGECDAIVVDARWNNFPKMRERLDKSFEKINELGAPHTAYITDRYRNLKQEELRLAYEYREKLYREREEQRAIREQMREDEKVLEDIKRKQKEIERKEKEQAEFQKKLDKAYDEGKNEKVKEYEDKIAELKKLIDEGQRSISMAQQTKAGHVYIISNIGSFGENVYKIGVTRRLNPMDRINELSSASVPFRFDVHAIIKSENAVELEGKLHKYFDEKRVNLINTKKEFFFVTLEDIEVYAKKNGIDIEFTKIAEAREYRESEAMRKNKKQENNKTDLNNIPKSI